MVTRGENVKKKLSELMDGELENADAIAMIDAVKNDSDLFSEWKIYHAIRDSLHQSAVSIDISEEIRNKLTDEPLILVPRSHSSKQNHKQKLVGFSVAASITVFFAGWFMFQSVEQQEEAALKEVYVAEKINAKPIPVSEQHPLLTFQPAPSYSFPSISASSNYPLPYRGVTYENTSRYPTVGVSPTAESVRTQPVTSSSE